MDLDPRPQPIQPGRLDPSRRARRIARADGRRICAVRNRLHDRAVGSTGRRQVVCGSRRHHRPCADVSGRRAGRDRGRQVSQRHICARTRSSCSAGRGARFVGVTMARNEPDLFAAYVGTGQAVSMRAGEPIVYRRVLEARPQHRGINRPSQSSKASARHLMRPKPSSAYTAQVGDEVCRRRRSD